jgi:outer membrane lipoprotein-sorting protein
MHARRPVSTGFLAGAFALALCGLQASAATAPALGEFDSAFAKINDYTMTVKAHEVSGNDTQDRVYHYWFKKPNEAKTLIDSGDGAGSGGVWNGGDKVSGHQGGFLSHFHLKVDLHDHRATSLRGYTIPDGLMQNEVGVYKTTKGELTQRTATFDGQPVDEVELKPADPAANGGVTRMFIDLSKSTHLPVHQVRYEGDKVVAEETFTDVKTNVGLTDGDFPF